MRVLLAVLISLAVTAPAALAEAGPGRVVFPFGSTDVIDGVDALGVRVGVAHPDGRTTYAGLLPGKGLSFVQLLATGAPDPGFGSNGVSSVDLDVRGGPLQVLRRPDGRFVVVALTDPTAIKESSRLTLVGLLADGRVDPAFGTGGIVRTGVQGSCDQCTPAALGSDGSVVLTGHTGTTSGNPTDPPNFTWVAARFTAAGAPDPAFDGDGVAQIPSQSGQGYGATILPDGSVALTGRDFGAGKLARLTAAGAPAPGFNGGAPVTISTAEGAWFGILGRADGAVDIARFAGDAATQVRRYTASGGLDPGFSGDGILDLSGVNGVPALLAGPDGSDIVAGPTTLVEGPGPLTLRTHRVNADGTVALEMAPTLAFGGGVATAPAFHRIPTATSIDQTGFSTGRPFARADGGVVVPGAVNVVRYAGEGVGVQTTRAAVAAFTPGFTPDPAFGGPAVAPTIRLKVPPQRARTAAKATRYAMNVTATASGPGLALLRVTDAKNVVIARSTAPVFKAGRQTLKAYLTKSGRKRLKHARNVKIKVSVHFRDLVYGFAEHKASGTLR
jgi:uncharacterized delta-60 repeat protein